MFLQKKETVSKVYESSLRAASGMILAALKCIATFLTKFQEIWYNEEIHSTCKTHKTFLTKPVKK